MLGKKSNVFLWVISICFVLILSFSSCSQGSYYSSERVFKARKEQNKRLRKRGLSNQQYKKSRRQRMRRSKKRERQFRRKRYRKYGSGAGKGRR